MVEVWEVKVGKKTVLINNLEGNKYKIEQALIKTPNRIDNTAVMLVLLLT
jgi:hypothetical protein